MEMLAVLLFLGACDLGPSWPDVQAVDTIEAYEQFLKDNPGSNHMFPAEKRLEELYFAAAQKDGSLAVWRAYHARFPKSPNKERAMKEMAFAAYADALKTGTVEGFHAFLDEFGKVDPRLRVKAQGRVAVLEYGGLTLGEPVVAQVNMAEDPKGELNGWGVSVPVTNSGDKSLPFVSLTLDYLADDGALLDTKDYPLVSPTWSLPATTEQKTPMKPGETRTWLWTEGIPSVPAEWHQKVRVTATGLRAE
jgi:hypothetical protein